MKNIYYITKCDFNNNTSTSLRIKNVCKTINLSFGYKASIFGWSNKIYINSIDGITLKHFKKGNNLINKFINFIYYPFRVIKYLKTTTKPFIIVLYGIENFELLLYKNYCKKNNIKIIYDAVEWYDYNNYKLKYINPLVWSIHITINNILPKLDGIIAISSFFNNFFLNKNIPTIIIPPLMEEKKISLNKIKSKLDSNYLNIIYTGIPGIKDCIWNVISGVQKLFKKGYKVKLHIFGCTYKYLNENYPDLLINKKCIKCYGYISHDDLEVYLKSADYSVLTRDPNNRKSKAGFSTKFVESLSYGLPVIANISGDLGNYLKDNYNGYILENESENAFIKKMLNIIDNYDNINPDIRLNAYKTFKQHFSISKEYSNKLINFFNYINKK